MRSSTELGGAVEIDQHIAAEHQIQIVQPAEGIQQIEAAEASPCGCSRSRNREAALLRRGNSAPHLSTGKPALHFELANNAPSRRGRWRRRKDRWRSDRWSSPGRQAHLVQQHGQRPGFLARWRRPRDQMRRRFSSRRAPPATRQHLMLAAGRIDAGSRKKEVSFTVTASVDRARPAPHAQAQIPASARPDRESRSGASPASAGVPAPAPLPSVSTRPPRRRTSRARNRKSSDAHGALQTSACPSSASLARRRRGRNGFITIIVGARGDGCGDIVGIILGGGEQDHGMVRRSAGRARF